MGREPDRCYSHPITAGALMALDDEGFVTLDPDSDGKLGAQRVVEFAQARALQL